MDEVPETVVFYEDENEYAMVISPTDALQLRNVLLAAAMDRAKRAKVATRRINIKRNTEEHELFAKYAERLDYIHQDFVNRFVAKMKAASSQD